MVFKKMLGALGVGGPSVDTVLTDPNTRPGAMLQGQVHLEGGKNDVDIEHVAVGLVTRVEVEGGGSEYNSMVEFHRVPVTGRLHLPAGARQSIPFQFPVPWETPITDVYGQRLHGMTMGLRTEVAIARAVDKGDLDPVFVHPLPVQEIILEAMGRLGFRFKSADLERGYLRGVHQSLPFYQEIEFWAAPQYSHALNEVELTFVANPHGLDVIIEVDKRGGLFTGGRDVFHHLRVDPATADRTDWAAQIDGWLNQAVLPRAGHYAPPGYGHGYGQPGHGYGQPGHGHGRGGFGAGAVIGGVAAGLVGGYVAGEIMDEVFDGDGGEDLATDFGDFGE
ncbi:sporulation protein [Planosporangium sp. 12N6]|uniref:sporulation protein n=1 Tax=Planosporangium spinosum TaxID=3402278 RepID=UPI003CEC8DD3